MTFTISGTNKSAFVTNKICKYLISFPSSAGLNDNLLMIPKVLVNVEPIFMTGIYYSNDVTRLNMQIGRSYIATFPSKIFLMVRSDT